MRHGTTSDGDQYSDQVPTFYLDENVQGITDEDHAVYIARNILGGGALSITAIEVDDELDWYLAYDGPSVNSMSGEES